MTSGIVSKYKDNVITSKKKSIYSNLIDYFSIFILGFIIYCFVSPFTSSMNRYQEIQNEVNLYTEQGREYISKSHLQFYDKETHELSKVENDAKNYIIGIAKTAAYFHDMYYPIPKQDGGYDPTHKVSIEETFIETDKLDKKYTLDNMSFYYLKFKKENSVGDYKIGDIDYGVSDELKNEYLYKKMMSYSEENINLYFISDSDETFVSKYKGLVSPNVILNRETAEILVDVMSHDSSTSGVASYSVIFDAYVRGVNSGANQIENYSEEYKIINSHFLSAYEKFGTFYFVVYLISYIVGYLLYFGIGFLVAKRPITFGQKIMKNALCANNETEPSWWQLIIYHTLCLVFYFSSCIIGLIFSGIIGVLSTPIIGQFTLLGIMIFLLIVNVMSIFCTLISKKNRDFQCLLSLMVLKNIDETEGVSIDDNAIGPIEQ